MTNRITKTKIKKSFITIYLSEDKKTKQVVRPQMSLFDGNWDLLAERITNGNHYSYETS